MIESKAEVRAAAQKSLRDWLVDGNIPKEYWDEIQLWLHDTGLEDVFYDGRDAVGAWWAAREVRRMGLAINFAKSGCLPSHWFPEGENWDLANANAKYALVQDWETLIRNDALVKIGTV